MRHTEHDPGLHGCEQPGRVGKVTGATDRPQLTRALAAARAGRFDILLVYRVDRLSRSIRGLSDILSRLDDAGVAFRSATEPFDTATAAGRMMVQMLAVFAEFERATIIDRVVNGMERKAARGQWCGGYRPYGYDLDRGTGYLTPVTDEVPIVRRIFTLYTRDRLGAATIAATLTADGYRTKAGKPWSPAAVLTVLRNRTYLGEVFFRDTWYRAERHHPCLISTELFDEAEQILIARGDDHLHRAGARSDYLLAGLIFCAHCGKRYLGTSAHGNKYRYRYYTCFTRHRYGTSHCPAPRLPADQVEHGVLGSLLDTLARTDLIEAALAEAQRDTTTQRASCLTELDTVKNAIAKNEAAIDRYLIAFENGSMPEATCAPRIQTLSRQTTELKHRRDELDLLIDETPPSMTPTAEHLNALADTIRKINSATEAAPAAVQTLLQAMTVKIDVAGRDNITPTFRIPTGPSTTPIVATSATDQEVCTLPGSVPPVGFEPTPPPPEGGALSPELRGPLPRTLAHPADHGGGGVAGGQVALALPRTTAEVDISGALPRSKPAHVHFGRCCAQTRGP
jgi:site-specific DNA recombinase